MDNCLIITESQYQKIMESEGTMSIPVEIPIELEYTQHSSDRKEQRGINDNLVRRHVKKILPRLLQSIINGERDAKRTFIIVNRNTCYIIPFRVNLNQLGSPSTVTVRTCWKYDGKRSLDKLTSENGEVFYMGKPSKAWQEARRTENEYSDIENEYNSKFLHNDRVYDNMSKVANKDYDALNASIFPQYSKKGKYIWQPSKKQNKESKAAWDEHEKAMADKKARQAEFNKSVIDGISDERFYNRRNSLNRVGLKGNTTKDQIKNIQMNRDWDEREASKGLGKDYSQDIDKIITANNNYLDGKTKSKKKGVKKAWQQHDKNDISPEETEIMNDFDNKPLFPGNSMAINERQARMLAIDECIDSLLNENDHLSEWNEWFDKYRGVNGEIDENLIAHECLDLLKREKKMTFDKKHQFIHLKNECKFFLRREDIAQGNLDMYEIWLPTGNSFDGEILSPDLDEAIQKELYNHIIWI